MATSKNDKKTKKTRKTPFGALNKAANAMGQGKKRKTTKSK